MSKPEAVFVDGASIRPLMARARGRVPRLNATFRQRLLEEVANSHRPSLRAIESQRQRLSVSSTVPDLPNVM